MLSGPFKHPNQSHVILRETYKNCHHSESLVKISNDKHNDSVDPESTVLLTNFALLPLSCFTAAPPSYSQQSTVWEFHVEVF